MCVVFLILAVYSKFLSVVQCVMEEWSIYTAYVMCVVSKSNYVTTGNSNTSVGVAFFYVCFSIHTEKFVIFLCVSKIPTEIFENPQKNYVIFLCVSIHTEKLTLFCRSFQNSQKNYVHAQKNYIHEKKT